MITAADCTAGAVSAEERFRYLLRLADTSLVLGQRLSGWVGHAPTLEEDLALGNITLDLIGQARLLLAYAGQVEGRGRDEDQLAFLRDAPEFFNVTLAEQPNGDFGQTIVRQALLDAWQVELYHSLIGSTDEQLANIAAKAMKECRYHWRFSCGWLVRLGDGTEESHARVQAALDGLWRFTGELLTPDALDAHMASHGIAPPLALIRSRWEARLAAALEEATLRQPPPAYFPWHGKRGVHSEHLGHLLTEMQHLQRLHPGATW